jgi:small subunit ribosomal protein S16
MGRKHRPYYRIVAIDGRQPRDGKYIEELGSYDPLVASGEQGVRLKPDRIKYWLSVGAQPSEKVAILLKKYLKKAEELAAAAPPSA